MSSRHRRALGALLLFLPGVLLCLLLAVRLVAVLVGRETPDRIHLSLLIVQAAGLGWPCAVAAGALGLSPRALGLGLPRPSDLPLAAGLSVGLWAPLLAADSLRARLFGDPEVFRTFQDLIEPGWGGYAAVVGILAVLPGLMEELAFRGILQPLLTEAWGGAAGIVAASAAFAAFHRNLEQLVVQFLLGLALGWLRRRTGSLWPCILVHALHNALSVWAMARLPGWEGPVPPFPPASWLAGGAVLAAASAWALARPGRRE